MAERFAESRATVENRAAVKAKPSPVRASRNLIHSSAVADCSHATRRLDSATLLRGGLVTAEPTGFEASIPGWNGQSAIACAKSVRNLASLVKLRRLVDLGVGDQQGQQALAWMKIWREQGWAVVSVDENAFQVEQYQERSIARLQEKLSQFSRRSSFVWVD